MPFTISHAAAVLPLRFFPRLPLAALMIGSMSPDFAYFLPGNLDRLATHDFAGLFWFCWPLALAAWLVYVHVLEAPTVALLPARWHNRFAPSDRGVSWRALWFASLAVIVGAVTHDAWDAFTHWNTVITGNFPIFYTKVFPFRHGHLRVFHVLQYLSSVVGLVVLAGWAARRPFDASMARAPMLETSVTGRVLALSLMLLTAVALAVASYWMHPDFFERPVFYVAVDGMLGWLLAWCVVALAIHWRARVL
jgi:uncharacterized protein DUF4184